MKTCMKGLSPRKGMERMNDQLLCDVSGTLRDVIKKIESNGKGIVFLTDEENKLMGVMTDGDIRRLLLSGCGLNETIVNHLNKNYVFASQSLGTGTIMGMLNDLVKIIPIVDEEGKVIDYFEYKNDIHVPIAHPQLKGNEYAYLMDAFLSTWISSSGKYIPQFEENFSDYCGTKYGIAVSNGTVALHLALTALDVGEGDEVIVPDITFAATINAVLYTGATPVIVDVEEDSWCIDPDEIEKAITDRTKAVIPVHIYGQPCDMKRICELAEKYHLYVIEDCAEAHGAEFNGKKVGSFGDIGCFSFFGNKVITTGEGGMCITSAKSLDRKMRILRDHGMSKTRKYYHEVVGFNYRMTNLQAAIGVAQLEQIEEILSWREALEDTYRNKLKGLEGLCMQNDQLFNRKKISWLVTVLVNADKRNTCMQMLKEAGIDARPFFIPLSQMDIYKKYSFSNINSQKLSERGFNLPTSNDVTGEIVDRIRDILEKVLLGQGL